MEEQNVLGVIEDGFGIIELLMEKLEGFRSVGAEDVVDDRCQICRDKFTGFYVWIFWNEYAFND